MRFSIRHRLILYYALAFLAILAILAALVFYELYVNLNRRVDRALRRERLWLEEQMETRYSALLHGKKDPHLVQDLLSELNEWYAHERAFAILEVHSPAGRHLFAGGRFPHPLELLPPDVLEWRPGFYSVKIQGRPYRLLIRRRDWGKIMVGGENKIFAQVAEELAKILLGLFPIILLVLLGGGWLMARLAFRPVVQAAETARSITLSNLDKRLPPYQGGDEFGILVDTLNQMIDRLAEGVQRVRQFTQDAAHELRTPLTVLRGEVELAYQDPRLPESLRETMGRLLDRIIGLQKLVDDLFLLARSDAQEIQLQKQPVPLHELLCEVVQDLEILVEARPLQVLLSRCEQVFVLGDRSLLYRLLMNLADNAVKYTPQGEIELSLYPEDGQAVVCIRDTGVGIPASDQAQIFERFYRASRTAHHASNGGRKGSGLGLAIARWIVQVHGGNIRLESTPGAGTKVQIFLPLYQPA